MEARPTGSGRERSSPNRCDQCRGQARQPVHPPVASLLPPRGAKGRQGSPGGAGLACGLMCGFAALAFLSRAAWGVARFARSPPPSVTPAKAGAHRCSGSRLSPGRCEACSLICSFACAWLPVACAWGVARSPPPLSHRRRPVPTGAVDLSFSQDVRSDPQLGCRAEDPARPRQRTRSARRIKPQRRAQSGFQAHHPSAKQRPASAGSSSSPSSSTSVPGAAHTLLDFISWSRTMRSSSNTSARKRCSPSNNRARGASAGPTRSMYLARRERFIGFLDVLDFNRIHATDAV